MGWRGTARRATLCSNPGSKAAQSATRVVQLKTQEMDAWSTWSRERLLDFVETRVGVADPEGSDPLAGKASIPTPLGRSDSGTDPPSRPTVLHRFGLLKPPRML